MKSRILILSSSTRDGHNARAQAFTEWIEHLYGDAVEVRTIYPLEDNSAAGRFGVSLYNSIQRRLPLLHHPYYCFIEYLGLLQRNSVIIGRGRYIEVLRSFRPHLVFSVHNFLNRGYFQTARRILGGEQGVKCVTYCGELSGGYGYSRNWVEKSVDLYISRTSTAQDYALALGVPPERARVRGNLSFPKTFHEKLEEQDKADYLRHLGLKPGRFTVLLATGGAGANNHLELLPVLNKWAHLLQVIAVCGVNRETREAIRSRREECPELLCADFGYTDEMHLLLQAADLMVARGGTATAAKALHLGCPIVFNCIGGVMPQERLTIKYFQQADACRLITRPVDLDRIFSNWRSSPGLFNGMKERFLQLRFEEVPSQLVTEIVDLAQTTAAKIEAGA